MGAKITVDTTQRAEARIREQSYRFLKKVDKGREELTLAFLCFKETDNVETMMHLVKVRDLVDKMIHMTRNRGNGKK